MLKKQNRITKENFSFFSKSVYSFQNLELNIKIKKNILDSFPKFGVIVPKKVLKKATKRNYLKRKIRIIFQHILNCNLLTNSNIGILVLVRNAKLIEMEQSDLQNILIQSINEFRTKFSE